MSGLFTKSRTIGLAAALMIFVCDQWSKYFVSIRLDMQLGDRMDLLPFFALHVTHNYGVSLGMFEATDPQMRWILVGATALIALIVLIWMMRERALGDIMGLAMIFGGALGNIYDRANLGYVLDFADFHIGSWSPFLIFNLADAAITVGVLIILARSFLIGDKKAKSEEASSQTSSQVPSGAQTQDSAAHGSTAEN